MMQNNNKETKNNTSSGGDAGDGRDGAFEEPRDGPLEEPQGGPGAAASSGASGGPAPIASLKTSGSLGDDEESSSSHLARADQDLGPRDPLLRALRT